MKIKLIAFFSLAGVLAICSPIYAHHGNAAYDMKEVMLKSATVTTFAWANPHTLITFDAKDDKGNLVHWAGELGSPSALTNLGWTKASVHPGDVITVYIHKSKVGSSVGRITHIALADGTELRDSSGAAEGSDYKGKGEGSQY
jgi:hypothetical protein